MALGDVGNVPKTPSASPSTKGSKIMINKTTPVPTPTRNRIVSSALATASATLGTNASSGAASSVDSASTESNIKVHLRIRPISDGTECIEVCEDNKSIKIRKPTDKISETLNTSDSDSEMDDDDDMESTIPDIYGDKYIFDHVFAPKSTQCDVFDLTARPLIDTVVQGENALLFAYGITNSGKTFTIQGRENDEGVLPRSIDALFTTLRQQQLASEMSEALRATSMGPGSPASPAAVARYSELKSIHQKVTEKLYSITISYLEIHNENIYDLLDEFAGDRADRIQLQSRAAGFGSTNGCGTPSQKTNSGGGLKLKTDARGRVSVQGLTEIEVTTPQEARSLLKRGQFNRQVGETNANQDSSRSHAVFTLKLTVTNMRQGGLKQMSQLSIVDLAGCERQKSAQTSGARLKEASKINGSLMVLGRCFEALRWNQTHPSKSKIVPFRECQITSLFKDALTGDGRVVMCVNVIPSAAEYEETLNTLKYSSIARDVVPHSSLDTGALRKKVPRVNGPSSEEKDQAINELSSMNILLGDEVQDLRRQIVLCEERMRIIEKTVRDECASEMSARLIDMERTYKQRLEDVEEESEMLQQQANRKARNAMNEMERCREVVNESILTMNLLKEELSQCQDVNNNYESQLLEANENITELQKSVANYEKIINDNKKIIDNTNQNTKNSSSEIAHLKKLLDDSKSEIVALKKQSLEYQSLNEELQRQVAENENTYEGDNECLQSRIQELEADLASAVETETALHDKIATLKFDLEERENEEMSELQHQLSSMQERAYDAEDTVARLTAAKECAEAALASMHVDANQLTTVTQKLREEHEARHAIEIQLQKALESLANVQQELLNKNSQPNTLESKILQLEAQNAILQARMEGYVKQIAKLKADKERVSENVEISNEEEKQQRGSNSTGGASQLEIYMSELKQERSKWSAEKATLLADAEATLNATIASLESKSAEKLNNIVHEMTLELNTERNKVLSLKMQLEDAQKKVDNAENRANISEMKLNNTEGISLAESLKRKMIQDVDLLLDSDDSDPTPSPKKKQKSPKHSIAGNNVKTNVVIATAPIIATTPSAATKAATIVKKKSRTKNETAADTTKKSVAANFVRTACVDGVMSPGSSTLRRGVIRKATTSTVGSSPNVNVQELMAECNHSYKSSSKKSVKPTVSDIFEHEKSDGDFEKPLSKSTKPPVNPKSAKAKTSTGRRKKKVESESEKDSESEPDSDFKPMSRRGSKRKATSTSRASERKTSQSLKDEDIIDIITDAVEIEKEKENIECDKKPKAKRLFNAKSAVVEEGALQGVDVVAPVVLAPKQPLARRIKK